MNRVDEVLCYAITGNIQTLCILVEGLSDYQKKEELIKGLPGLVEDALKDRIGRELLANAINRGE